MVLDNGHFCYHCRNGFGNFGETGLSGLLVMMAVPHDVVSVSALSFAVRVVTQVASVYSRCFKAVWGSNAPSEDRLEEPSILLVRAV